MPTIIDSLVIEFSLDPTKFTEGQKKVVDSLKNVEEAAEKHAKGVNKQTKEMAEGFTGITKALGELTAGYLTVSGISSFIQSTNAANLAIGQQATILGMLPEKLARFQQAAKLAGVDQASMSSSINNLYRGMFSGPGGTPNPGMITAAAQMGMDPSVLYSGDPTAVLRSISQTYKRNPLGRSQGQLNNFMSQMGLSEQTVYMIDRMDKSLETFLELAKKANATTNAQADSAKDITGKWGEMTTAATKLGNVIARDMNGPLGKLLELFTWLIDKVGKFVELLEILGGALSGAIIGSGLGAILGAVIGFAVGGPPGAAAGAIAGAGIGARVGGAAGAVAGAVTADEHAANAAADKTRAGGAGAGSLAGGGAAVQGGAASLKEERARMKAEVDKDPKLAATLRGLAVAEDAHDPAGVIESLANRAAYTGKSIRELIGRPGGSGFYGPMNRGQVHPNNSQRVQDAIDSVWEGSNRLKGATDQGSAGDPNAHWQGGRILPPGASRGAIYNDWGGGPGGHEGARQFRLDQQRRIQNAPSGGSNSIIPPTPAESWPNWIGRHVPNYWHSTPPVTNNKQSSMSIGNMNFHGVRDMNDVASNIEPFLKQRFTALAADNGYG